MNDAINEGKIMIIDDGFRQFVRKMNGKCLAIVLKRMTYALYDMAHIVLEQRD